jgi:hypothetical protein
LRTYNGENGPREAGDDGVGGGSSSKRRIGMGGSGVAVRWRWRGSAMAARVGQIHTGYGTIYRVFWIGS